MKKILLFISIVCAFGGMTSCSDFFDVDSTYIIDGSKNHLGNSTDTIYSVTGILNKLQAIADRTILLGEARGDLMTVTEETSADLRDVANFNISADNKYNNPTDYYAIINNCNYFLAHADTMMKNNRNEYLFRKEYAAVKAIRAWTYLQLVTTYGKVPFVTKPVLTKEEAESPHPMYDINQVCSYFINEDGLQDLVDQELPDYGDIKSMPSRLFMIPVRLVLGDLNLWAGNYLEAAKCYHGYLTKRNGENSIYPIGTNSVRWNSNSWDKLVDGWSLDFSDESYKPQGELITIIPMDSIPSEGNYSELRSIYNSTYSDNYKVSLVPSQSLLSLSEAQDFCYNDHGDCTIVPKGLEMHRSGDLRLSQAWFTMENVNLGTLTGNTNLNERIDYQTIYKQVTKNIHIYRRTLVYLRLAEALNRAGYPSYAFHILSTGVNTEIIKNDIVSYIPEDRREADSTLLVTAFDFRGTSVSSTNSSYVVINDPNSNLQANTIGIHSRGCGFTPGNVNYQMPTGTLDEQIKAVEDLIINEGALEFAFEGYRYYDLLRVALRREASEPDYLFNKINARNGSASSGVAKDLHQKANWFLNWNGQIGL